MPDLGQYAVEVLLAYAGSILLLIALIVATILRAKQVRRQLEDVEARRRGTP